MHRNTNFVLQSLFCLFLLNLKEKIRKFGSPSGKGSANDLNQEDRGKIKDSLSLGRSDLLEPKSELDDVRVKKRGMGPGKGRSNRGRTVLTEKQRTILTACFQHNPKPDALLKVRFNMEKAIPVQNLIVIFH